MIEKKQYWRWFVYILLCICIIIYGQIESFWRYVFVVIVFASITHLIDNYKTN